jgi:hypothetical protein
VEVIGSVLLRGVVRLISPVDTDFLSGSDVCSHTDLGMRAYVVVDTTAVESRHASLGRPRVIVLDEPIVEAL